MVFSSSFPPTWPIPAPLTRKRSGASATVAYPRSYVIDPVTGDLMVDGAGRMVVSTPHEAAAQAAAFLVTVQHVTYPIFKRSFGLDIEGLIGSDMTHKQIETRLAERMRRSAIRDPRLRNLEEFAFVWSRDTLDVSYTLVLADGTRIRQRQVIA